MRWPGRQGERDNRKGEGGSSIVRRNAEGRAARAQSLNKSDPSVEAAALGEPRQSAADVRAMGSSPPLLPSSSMFHLCYFGARRGGLRTAASLDFPLYRPPALSSPLPPICRDRKGSVRPMGRGGRRRKRFHHLRRKGSPPQLTNERSRLFRGLPDFPS